MLNRPKIIVFDIGGVLLNWKVVIPLIANKLKITPEQFHQELQKSLVELELGKMHQDEFWRHLCEKYKYNGNFRELKKIWIEDQPRIEYGWKLAKSAKENKFRVVCCTNNWKDTVKRQKEIHPDFSLFEFILDSGDLGIRKPDEEIYRIIEDKVGESGQEILLIDDSQENCEGASRLGWQTYQFNFQIGDSTEKFADLKRLIDRI